MSRHSDPRKLSSCPPGSGLKLDFEQPESVLPMLLDAFQRYGDVFKLSSHRVPWTYVISHPDMVAHVLGRNYLNYRKGFGIDRVNVLLGQGLMVSEGALWKSQRRLLQPMFHRTILENLAEHMIRGNQSLLKTWRLQQAAGEAINLTRDMGTLALDFILRALISEDLDRLIHEQGTNPFALVTEDSTRDLMFARRFRALTRLVSELIQTRRTENRWPQDWLSMLVQARDRDSGEPIPEKLLIDEVLTLIIAGHETTASALNWCWYLVAQHPEVEQCLLAEVDRELKGQIPEWGDLKRLVYTRQVLLEAMRLYPPGWLITRRALGADVIAGYEVTAGTDVLIAPYLIHRHPDFWEHPEQFRPQRFAPEQLAQRPQGSYLAFSMGPRNCIGETLAMQEMLMHMALMSQQLRLRLTPQAPVALDAQVNLRPKNDLFFSVEFR